MNDQDLEASIAAQQKELDARRASAANIAHFKSEDGQPLTNPGEINDAMLRATGLALQERTKSVDWQAADQNDAMAELQSALKAEDFVGVALYAAILNARKAMGA